MAQDLMMTFRVDVDLWKRFERAAEKARQPAEDLIVDFMRGYAATAEPVNLDLFDFAPAACDQPIRDQLDLEDYLNAVL